MQYPKTSQLVTMTMENCKDPPLTLTEAKNVGSYFQVKYLPINIKTKKEASIFIRIILTLKFLWRRSDPTCQFLFISINV